MRTVIALLLLGFTYSIKTANAASPVFNTPPSDGSGTKSVSEDAAVDSSILTLQATDTDGETLTFSVASQTPATPAFSIDSVTDNLEVPSGLDYETATSFTLTLSVSDGTNAVTTTYTVTITDVDDESPVFSQNTYTATVMDSATAGTSVTTVTATDADSGSFTYSIQGAQTTFAISAGVITVNDPSGLSALGASVTLNLEANDGTNAGTATVTVTIQASPCNASPCQNGGTCTVTGNTYSCACLSGYTGTNCESVDRCSSNPCENDATCTSETTDYTCDCKTCGYNTNCTEDATGICYLGHQCSAKQQRCICVFKVDDLCLFEFCFMIACLGLLGVLLVILGILIIRYIFWAVSEKKKLGPDSFKEWWKEPSCQGCKSGCASFKSFCKQGPCCQQDKSGTSGPPEYQNTGRTSDKSKEGKKNGSGTSEDHEYQNTGRTSDKSKEGKKNGSSDNRPSNASTEAEQKKHDNQPDQLEMVQSHKSTDM